MERICLQNLTIGFSKGCISSRKTNIQKEKLRWNKEYRAKKQAEIKVNLKKY